MRRMGKAKKTRAHKAATRNATIKKLLKRMRRKLTPAARHAAKVAAEAARRARDAANPEKAAARMAGLQRKWRKSTRPSPRVVVSGGLPSLGRRR
jgi:hypothetical protein